MENVCKLDLFWVGLILVLIIVRIIMTISISYLQFRRRWWIITSLS